MKCLSVKERKYNYVIIPKSIKQMEPLQITLHLRTIC